MIITDGIHLVSDISEAELHAFAANIGLKRSWYQGKKRGHPHYDLTTTNKLQVAMAAGARRVTPAELFQQAWWSTKRKQQLKMNI